MFEEKIFGPLTFKQFLLVAAGLLAIFFIYQNTSTTTSIPLSIIIALVIGTYIARTKYTPFTEENLQIYRAEIGEEKFNRFAQKKIAELQSQIHFRNERGFADDSKLQEAITLIEKIKNDI